MKATMIALLLGFLTCPLPAHRPPSSPLQLEILVNGGLQPLYPHGGRYYLEAIRGAEFTVRLTNRSSNRIAVALSVDGLNTIDAKRTPAASAAKWVLDPWETVEINGWQVSSSTSRSFFFTTEANSYGAALGQTRNLGIISAAVFREIPSRPPVRYARDEEYLPDVADGRTKGQEARPAAEKTAPRASNASSGAVAGCVPPPPPKDDDYAATGMGRERDNAVSRVHLQLESTACQQIDVRYEYRSQLIRLGVLPRPSPAPQSRRDSAKGFEDAYCPVVR